MNKVILNLAALLAASSVTLAATFSGGGGAGTSIVDAAGTGDYTTLAAAAADFTSYPGGCTGNWNLLIRSDLTETTSSLFGNDTNGHTVTVRPASGTSVTVSYMISERPSDTAPFIWDGNIVIGPNKLVSNSQSLLIADSMRYMEMDNFIIDGCNTPGGTERNLTILTPVSANVGSPIHRYAIRVVGDVDDSIIRNCTIESNVPGNAADRYICVLYNSRYVSEGALLYSPENARVENCGLIALKGSTGRGVFAIDTGGVPTALHAMQGMVITNNDISVSHRAVQFGANAGGDITYNRIRVLQETTGQRPEVIIHTGSNGVETPWVTNIIGNHISQVETPVVNGFNYMIGVGGVAANTQGATFNIINNMIGGVNGSATISTTGNLLGRAIAFESGSTQASLVFNIRHNSISMRDIPNYGAAVDDTANRMAVLSLLNANGFAGTLNFENNIISYRQHNASVISNGPTGTTPGTLNFNNNTYHLGTGTKFAELNGVVYNTLADWQGAGRDLASNVADPFAPPSGGAWKSDSDLHFNADPAGAFKTTAIIAGITTDIDQNPRPAVTVTKGADEYVPPQSNVSAWTLY